MQPNADAFENNQTVKDLQKYPHAQQGILDPKLDDYGVFVLTNYRGMPIYSSEAVYEADDGSVVNYVPANMCLVASTAIQHKNGICWRCRTVDFLCQRDHERPSVVLDWRYGLRHPLDRSRPNI